MSTLGLWIVTGINSALIALVGGFTYFGLGGITRVVTETGSELTEKVTEVSTQLPKMIEEVIEKEGANAAGAATNMANNQVSNLTGDATSAGIEMTNLQNKGENMLPQATAALATTPVTTATLTTTPVTTAALATKLRGGGKQTKGNKPKRIRKPRTKKNIKKIGNQMYMNFSI
jgi:hypothetical protein